jgi:hypothetical protein
VDVSWERSGDYCHLKVDGKRVAMVGGVSVLVARDFRDVRSGFAYSMSRAVANGLLSQDQALEAYQLAYQAPGAPKELMP